MDIIHELREEVQVKNELISILRQRESRREQAFEIISYQQENMNYLLGQLLQKIRADFEIVLDVVPSRKTKKAKFEESEITPLKNNGKSVSFSEPESHHKVFRKKENSKPEVSPNQERDTNFSSFVSNQKKQKEQNNNEECQNLCTPPSRTSKVSSIDNNTFYFENNEDYGVQKSSPLLNESDGKDENPIDYSSVRNHSQNTFADYEEESQIEF